MGGGTGRAHGGRTGALRELWLQGDDDPLVPAPRGRRRARRAFDHAQHPGGVVVGVEDLGPVKSLGQADEDSVQVAHAAGMDRGLWRAASVVGDPEDGVRVIAGEALGHLGTGQGGIGVVRVHGEVSPEDGGQLRTRTKILHQTALLVKQ